MAGMASEAQFSPQRLVEGGADDDYADNLAGYQEDEKDEGDDDDDDDYNYYDDQQGAQPASADLTILPNGNAVVVMPGSVLSMTGSGRLTPSSTLSSGAAAAIDTWPPKATFNDDMAFENEITFKKDEDTDDDGDENEENDDGDEELALAQPPPSAKESFAVARRNLELARTEREASRLNAGPVARAMLSREEWAAPTSLHMKELEFEALAAEMNLLSEKLGDTTVQMESTAEELGSTSAELEATNAELGRARDENKKLMTELGSHSINTARILMRRTVLLAMNIRIRSALNHWSDSVTVHLRKQLRMGRVLARVKRLALAKAMRTWLSIDGALEAQQSQDDKMRGAIRRALGKLSRTNIRHAMVLWKTSISEAKRQERNLVRVVQFMKYKGHTSTKQVLLRWVQYKETSLREKELLRRATVRMVNAKVRRALASWIGLIAAAKDTEQVYRAVARMHRLAMAKALQKWASFVAAEAAQEFAAHRYREVKLRQFHGRWSQKGAAKALTTWIRFVDSRLDARVLLRQILARLSNLKLSHAHALWKTFLKWHRQVAELTGAFADELFQAAVGAVAMEEVNGADEVQVQPPSDQEPEAVEETAKVVEEKIAHVSTDSAPHDDELKKEEDKNEAAPDLTRLMIYSSDTPDIADFSAMIKCQKARYDFNTDGTDQLIGIINNAVAANGGQKLKSIALACHGPPPDADGDIDEDEAAAGVVEEQFRWPITKSCVILDHAELQDPSHPARRLMDALGHAVENHTGRVDLLACSLLKSHEGKEVFEEIEKETKCDFAASDNKTGNPREPDADWIMESDNVDIRDFYFHSTDAFDGTFSAESKEAEDTVQVSTESPPQIDDQSSNVDNTSSSPGGVRNSSISTRPSSRSTMSSLSMSSRGTSLSVSPRSRSRTLTSKKEKNITHDGPCLHQGHLLKLGGGTTITGRRNWKRRWFVLHKNVFSYCKLRCFYFFGALITIETTH